MDWHRATGKKGEKVSKEMTRNYRFDSFAYSAEMYRRITGDDTWSESDWEIHAETVLADIVREPQYWIVTEYEEEDWG
jgi:hypothetical protein